MRVKPLVVTKSARSQFSRTEAPTISRMSVADTFDSDFLATTPMVPPPSSGDLRPSMSNPSSGPRRTRSRMA
jgi:hypothetical protein